MREMRLEAGNSEILNLFKKIKRFKVFSDEEMTGFIKKGKLLEYARDEVVFKQGATDRMIYFLISGELKIEKRGQTIATLKRCGDLFGEMAIIDNSPRSATIRSMNKSIVLGFDAEHIDQNLKAGQIAFCYTIYRIFAEVLAVRLRETTKENMRLKSMLPSLPGEPPPIAAPRKRPTQNDLQDKKVLIVDHDMKTRKLLRSVLQEFKFQEIIETRGKAQALDVLRDERVDLILSEINLPKESGIKLLKKVREADKTKQIPFIVITNDSDQYKISQAVQAGVTDYIIKPITPKILFERITSSLKKQSSRQDKPLSQ